MDKSKLQGQKRKAELQLLKLGTGPSQPSLWGNGWNPWKGAVSDRAKPKAKKQRRKANISVVGKVKAVAPMRKKAGPPKLVGVMVGVDPDPYEGGGPEEVTVTGIGKVVIEKKKVKGKKKSGTTTKKSDEGRGPTHNVVSGGTCPKRKLSERVRQLVEMIAK